MPDFERIHLERQKDEAERALERRMTSQTSPYPARTEGQPFDTVMRAEVTAAIADVSPGESALTMCRNRILQSLDHLDATTAQLSAAIQPVLGPPSSDRALNSPAGTPAFGTSDVIEFLALVERRIDVADRTLADLIARAETRLVEDTF